MGIFGTLFGKNRLKRPNREQVFSVISAEIALSERSDIKSTAKAGIVFNPVDSSFFSNLDEEINNLLKISGNETGTVFRIVGDTHGTTWVCLEDPDFEDMVATIHLIQEVIIEHGFGERLIAAVFGLEFDSMKAYWIYNYKRGKFYPMVLSGIHSRDNASEMRLAAIMEEEGIPVERKLESWYSLWDVPI